uniref:F-box protein AT5G49610-like beta-propeller domain-containing protein n=1 Tax=Arundo donax TaxID=35708 RepID=A0A0A9GIW4_ARUDO
MAPPVAIAVVLGEDLLREVFIRLPAPDDLLRAALACKPFLHAARSSPFLRRFRRVHPFSCPRLLGCLLLRPGPRRRNSPVLLTYPSSSSAAAAAAHRGDFALSFLPGFGWQGDAAWQLLDCRNGLLLLKNVGSRELAVANPVARRYVCLPAPPTERAVGHGLVADDGDSSAFRVVCVSRDAASRELRALVLSSGELAWSDVGGRACEPDLVGSRPMQANRSLYWRLEGGERMVAFSTATMEFSMLQVPPSLRQLSFDVVEKGEEEGNVLHLLTMSGFCIEVWAGTGDGDGGMAWRRVEKSVRFHKVVTKMFRPSAQSYQHELDVVGVAAGVVFVRQWDNLFSIDLETMKLRVLSKKDCSGALIYPYTIVWPPSFFNLA